MAGKLLGSNMQYSPEGGASYRGDKGQIAFYPDGRFVVQLTAGAERADVALETHGKSFLEKLGIQAVFVGAGQDGPSTEIVFRKTIDAAPIYSCDIRLYYYEDSLYHVNGWRVLGEVSSDGRMDGSLDAVTLLMRLVQESRAQGIACKEITAIETGFVYSSSGLTAQSTLIPVWWVEIDGETLLLNAINGNIESKAAWLHE